MNKREKMIAMIAYHEAGHAVVARSLGIGVSFVTLLGADAESEAAARTHSATWLARNDDQAAQLAAIEKDAKVCLAGLYAQSRYRARKMTEKIKQQEWGDDISNARSFACRAVLVGHGVEVPDGMVTLNDEDAADAVQIFNRI